MLIFSLAQYNAWCLNNGNHRTRKRDHVCWNAELIWKMRMELDLEWDILEEEIPDIFDDLLQAVKGHLQDLKAAINRKTHAQCEIMQY